jgi:hypothetical protein
LEAASFDMELGSLKQFNVSDSSFFIEKADMILRFNDKTTRFIFSVKHEKPDRYLLSLKSSSGLEGARVYLTRDTLLINDRLNRKLLSGKAKDIERTLGIPYDFINLIFGDIITIYDTADIAIERSADKVVISQPLKSMTLTTIIDFDILKPESAVFLNSEKSEVITLKYSKHLKTDKRLPGVVEVKDSVRNLTAKIRFYRIQIPWYGKIEFIPGKGYTKEEIR